MAPTTISASTTRSPTKRRRTTKATQNQDAVAGPSRSSRQKKTSQEKKQKPPPEPEENWPESDLGETTITATLATQWYRISSEELKVLRFTVERSSKDEIMHLYKAREVERLAWAKHGGPAGWKWKLDVLRERYHKRYPGKPFPEPKWTEPLEFKRCVICKSKIWQGSDAYYDARPKHRACESAEAEEEAELWAARGGPYIEPSQY